MQKNIALFLMLLFVGLGAKAQTITNNSFENGTNGWTIERMQVQSNDGLSTYKAGSNYLERWIAAPGLVGYASVKQTLTGLSNGVYRLTAAAMNLSQNNENAAQVGAWIVGNGLRTLVTTRNNYTLDFFVTDGTAEIGFVADGASGNWVGCDNFQLTYLGNSSTYIQSAGNTVKTYANNLINSVGSDTQYSNLISTLTTAINNGNLTNVANAAKAVVAGERAYRLRHPSGSAPTVMTRPRHARGSVWIFGRLEQSGSNVVEEGFCWSTSPNPTLGNDNYSTDWLNSNGKIIWMQGLTPGTIYYVRAYAMTKNYAVGYGDVIKVPTLPQGNIHWSYGNEGDAEINDRINNAASWAFDHYWSNLTQMTSFYPSLHYASGTPTADCSYGGWMRIGPNTSYQRAGTIMHEALHGVGVGTHWMWTNDRGDFNRNQFPVWDALRFLNNDESAVLSGDAQHMWPYGINGAQEDNGSDLLYIGNSLLCEALGEGGLPLTDGQWLLPYYAFPQDDNTKYYLKCEDKDRGLLTAYLVENASGNLEWKEMSIDQAKQSSNRAAWYITFDASIQKYRFKNAATNHYITYNAANSNTGFKAGSTASDIQMKKCRVNVNVGSQTYNGYYLLDFASSQSLEAKASGAAGSTGFSIWDDATTQRWVILAENELTNFESGAIEIQIDKLRKYLNGYTAAKNVSHTDKTSGATTALTNAINTINSAIAGTVTMDQVVQYIEDIKAAGLNFLNNTMPSNGGYYDLTFLIDNADFTESSAGWSLDPTRNYGSVEFYQTTFDFYQILPNMPNGKYQFTVDAFQRPGANADVYTAYTGGTDNVNAVMYINSTSQKIKNVMAGQQNTSISNGEFTTAGNTYVPNTMESGSTYIARNKYNNVMQGEFPVGDLRIGLRGTVSDAYYWTMADNFKLYFLGSEGVVVTMKEQLANDGFTPITALPTDYSPFFFVLYDHDQDLGMTIKNGNHQGNFKSMWYEMDINPRTDKEALWTLDAYEKDGNNYQIMANATNPDFMFQTEWNAGWDYRCSDNGGGDPGWGRTTYEYLPDGYWTIQNGVYPEAGYLGPWEAVFADDSETALNKVGANVGHFDVFTILRGEWVKKFGQVDDATFESPVDISYVLENPGGERRTEIGWKTTGANWQGQGNTVTGKLGSYYLESYNASGIGNSEFYQEISGLPDGFYRFSAKAFVRDGGEQGLRIFANAESAVVTASDLSTRFNVIVQVFNGTLRVGAKAENVTKDWIGLDDAKLEYLGISIPGYNVGEPSSNIKNGVYTGTQELITWTLTFTEANSNVESAVFAKLNNTAKATLKKGNTKVGDYVIYFSGKTASVNFNGVTLDADATYTLEFPEGVVGYAGQVSNEAYSVTFNTPHYFTGTYYLYNKITDSFLGLTDGTNNAYVSQAGSAITWEVTENGAKIKFNDNNAYLGGFYWSITNDAAGYDWAPVAYDENGVSGYQLIRTPAPAGAWPGNYLYISEATEGNDHLRVASNGLIDDNFTNWAYAVWELWTPAEHDAYVVTIIDVNNDNVQDFNDVKAIAQILIGKDPNKTIYNHDAADVDHSGTVTLKDLTLLVNILTNQ